MMIRSTLILSCLLLAAPGLIFSFSEPDQIMIRSIEVHGNVRVPKETVLHYIASAPDKAYNEAQTRGDLRRLFDTGLFRKVDIQTVEAGPELIDLVFEIQEQPVISEFVIEGVSHGEQDQLQRQLKQEKLEIKPLTPFHPGEVNRAANYLRSYLRGHKHPFAEVRIVTEDEREGTTRVVLRAEDGPELDVGEVQFTGNQSIPSGDLIKQLKYTRPAPFFMPWAPSVYMPDTAAADLDSLRRYYQSKGFAAVQIGTPTIIARDFPRPYRIPLPKINGPRQKLAIAIPIVEGPVYKLLSVKSEGGTEIAAAEMREILAKISVPGRYDNTLLDTTRQKMVDALGHYGYALAQVELEQNINDAERTVAATYRISPGNPLAIGRIQFEGNTKVKDKFLRREVVPREGQIYDSAKLDESIRRINKSGMVNELRRADVSLALNSETQLLDITFKVKEKDRQGIYGTGGTGGIAGGYLGVLYTAFDLLGIGEFLTMQLDGGASQQNMLLNIVGSRFLGLPFTLGLSVFHRLTDYNIASIVPDATDLYHLLKRRSTGFGLSGAYPITSHTQVGLSTQFQKLSLTELAADGSVAQKTVENRLDVAPSFVFDNSKGIGPELRGTRFGFTNAWSGTDVLKTVDSVAQSIRFSHYVGDPLTHGRNSFAFRLQGAAIRPRNDKPLTVERRFYPGDEIVRGFNRGGLSTWAYDSTTGEPTPVGSDTVLGFALEYRIPIQGPFSATAFFDLGWSGLAGKNVDPGTASRLIEETNRILRASVGGEFRIQLPLVHQPGRFIFSWNPLRIGQFIRGKEGLLKLVDPRGTFHFALGDRF